MVAQRVSLSNIFSLNPVADPKDSRTYYLKSTNTNGCVDIDTVNVKVICNGFNLPNAFEPDNSRGAPRTFGLLNRDINTLYYFRIFDRWGRMVFSTTKADVGWDGTINGEKAPFGVYVWEAKGACSGSSDTDAPITTSGNVTLIR